MSTVRDIAALLPAPAELRAHLSALAVLEAYIGDGPELSCYQFCATGDLGALAAMDNGAGDGFSVHFTAAGVFIGGFDYQSPMNPYATADNRVWPGVIDEVPAGLRHILHSPTFRNGVIDAPLVTACLWRETHDTAWRTGSTIDFPNAVDPDGAGHLFSLLSDRSPEAVQAHFEDYYEHPVSLDVVRRILNGAQML